MKVVGVLMHIQEHTSFVTFVQTEWMNKLEWVLVTNYDNKPDTSDHAGSENPVVFLLAFAFHAVDA